MTKRLMIGLCLGLAGCGESVEQIKSYSEQCVSMYKNKRASSGADVQAGDHWTKEGKLVIEMQERATASDTSYSSSVCVVDEKAGTIELPSMLEMGRWSR